MEIVNLLVAATVCLCNEMQEYVGLVTFYVLCRKHALGLPCLLILLVIYTYTEIKQACIQRMPKLLK